LGLKEVPISSASRDHEAGGTISTERSQQRVHPLRPFKSPGEQKEAITKPTRDGVVLLPRITRLSGNEMGKMAHREIQSEFPVFPHGEKAWRKEGVHGAHTSFEKAGSAPELGGTAADKLATGASPSLAHLPPIAPEDVHGTDKPMLVQGVKFDRTSEIENRGPTHKGDVVEVYYVETSPLQNRADASVVQERPPDLLHGQQLEQAQAAPKRMKANPRLLGEARMGRSRREKTVSVYVVDHLD